MHPAEVSAPSIATPGTPEGVVNSSLQIDVDDGVGATAVRVKGRIDQFTAWQLRMVLTEVIERGRSRPIHLDLAEASLIDCSGPGILVRAWRHARHRGSSLWIDRFSPQALAPLRTLGLETMLCPPRQASDRPSCSGRHNRVAAHRPHLGDWIVGPTGPT